MAGDLQVRDEGSIFWGSFWMLVLSVLLFWLPGLGSLIAGVVGGKIAGGVGRAFIASIIPSIALGAILGFLIKALTGVAWVAWLAGFGIFAIAVGGAAAMVLGALIGGLLAAR